MISVYTVNFQTEIIDDDTQGTLAWDISIFSNEMTPHEISIFLKTIVFQYDS